ncbi:hypothetical protein JF50_12655 [Pseudoalteromonas luteoviolacea]|uniref:Uncharacterized protein n=1 Tax=Pseudoalteromonas luteoviolacea TaxID=43657 RepID=A0A023PZQ8_9GAMM|nr:hypothetical protein [Pseudoalteromonas luteoviolacea]AHX39708.1 hypothetical protein [Pseudoalteromonas luteoviolacea]KID56754.1 hypothetical protein JF50_12655 [Pseudoalteromonas luteoviolacea]
MNNVKLSRFLSITLLICMPVGCYKEGVIRGSNELLINGSLLKGTMAYASIIISDAKHATIWQGQSDEFGSFDSQFSVSENSVFYIEVKAIEDTTMVCDAVECFDSDGGLIANYQEVVTAPELAHLQLNYMASSNNLIGSVQVNALTSLVYGQINNKLNQGTSLGEFDSIAQQASQVVLTALNLPDQQRNILATELTPVNQLSTEQEQTLLLLSLVNAAVAENTAQLAPLITAIKQFSTQPEDAANRDKLSALKTALMASSVKLAQSGLVKNIPDDINRRLHEAQTQPINFDLLKAENIKLQADIQAVNVTGVTGGNG